MYQKFRQNVSLESITENSAGITEESCQAKNDRFKERNQEGVTDKEQKGRKSDTCLIQMAREMPL